MCEFKSKFMVTDIFKISRLKKKIQVALKCTNNILKMLIGP